MNETTLTLTGNLTADPELRFTGQGVAIANFTIAATPRTYDRQTGEWKDGDALFMRCTAWKQLAENIAQSLTRGMRVIATGRLKQRSFETRAGEKRTVIELEVDEIGPSLRNATATVTKAQRAGTPDNRRAGADDPWASAPTAPSASTGYEGEPPF